MTYLENEESLRYLERCIYRYGIIEALEEKGIQDGDTVAIESYEFVYYKDRYVR